VLRERCADLRAEVDNLTMLIREHRDCGNTAIRDFLEREKTDGVEGRGNSSRGQRSTGLVEDDETNGQTRNGDIDMSCFLVDDDELPSLSSSRKTSASSTDCDLELSSTLHQCRRFTHLRIPPFTWSPMSPLPETPMGSNKDLFVGAPTRT